jgi:uncharacterized protein YndB with AHSA1/START domain
MTIPFDPDRDLSIRRFIRAQPSEIWRAWTVPSSFERWWVPAPAKCQVIEMELRPGGALTTHIDESGAGFVPHLEACFLDLVENQRIVFTNALVKGWRPAQQPFMSAVITLTARDGGTEYAAHVMHKDSEQQQLHATLGFADGWGTVIEQLARFVEAGRTQGSVQ